MLLIKFFINDKIVFCINLIILIMISKSSNISDMNNSSLILFLLEIGLLSYLISVCLIMLFLILIHLLITNKMEVNYTSLSFSKKIRLIANTLENYENSLNSINTFVLYIHKNQQDDFY